MDKIKQIKLRPRDRQKIKDLLRRGKSAARIQSRCRILLLSEEGRSTTEIVNFLHTSSDTVRRIRMRYRREGLNPLLSDKPRSGRPRNLTASDTQRIVALACSNPPRGFSQWSVRLLAKEAGKGRRGVVVSKTMVGRLLKEHQLKPWRKKNVVRSNTQP